MASRKNIVAAVGGSALGHLVLVGAAVGWVAVGGIPENDNFSLRMKLGEVEEAITTGSNYAASRERGEPIHAGAEPQSGSVWWSWQAPKGTTDALVEVELQGAEALVGIYNGFAIDKLELVTSSSNGTLSFEPVAGTDYHIAVAGNGQDAEGWIRLRLQAFSEEDSETPQPEDNETALLLPEITIEEKSEGPELSRFVRTDPNQSADRAPVDSTFESDRDTLASSEIDPEENGLKDMPSQAGSDSPFFELKNRKKVRGELKVDATIPIAAVEVAEPAVAEMEIDPKLLADTGEFVTEKPSDEARAGEESITNERMADAEVAFQPESEQNKIVGTIENRGSGAAVDAAETPLGRYNRLVTSAIDKHWADERVRKNVSLPFGSLKVSFAVDLEGNAGHLKILEDDAPAKVTDFFLDVILNADIPPMPEEVRKQLGGQALIVPYSVIIN